MTERSLHQAEGACSSVALAAPCRAFLAHRAVGRPLTENPPALA